MKVRQGFVSNSSSSSFIIRGAEISMEEVAKSLEITCEDKREMYDEIDSKLWKKIKGHKLVFERNADFFSDEIGDSLIIGESLGHIEDGEVFKVPSGSTEKDKEIINKIKQALDVGVKELSTYFQYISNDNY